MNNCTYCKNKLKGKFSFSFPVDGIVTIFACDRWWCKIFIRRYEKMHRFIRRKWYKSVHDYDKKLIKKENDLKRINRF